MTQSSSSSARRPQHPLRRLLMACGFGTASLLASADPSAPLPAEAKAAGLVAVEALIPNLRFDVRYATADNFVGRPLYPGVHCWLQRSVAERLAKVQAALNGEGLGLKVFDCYRPFSVQEQLWTLVPDERYVGKPARGPDGKPVEGSRHNRGAAVDLSLVDLASGEALPMPTDYDDFSERAHRDYRQLDAAVLANRARLEAAMAAEGFSGLATEWWHFDAPGWEHYPLLDIPLR